MDSSLPGNLAGWSLEEPAELRGVRVVCPAFVYGLSGSPWTVELSDGGFTVKISTKASVYRIKLLNGFDCEVALIVCHQGHGVLVKINSMAGGHWIASRSTALQSSNTDQLWIAVCNAVTAFEIAWQAHLASQPGPPKDDGH